jgi:hypothetical protein
MERRTPHLFYHEGPSRTAAPRSRDGEQTEQGISNTEKDEDDSVVDLDLEDDSELCVTLDENSMERVFQAMLVLDTMDFDEELNSE